MLDPAGEGKAALQALIGRGLGETVGVGQVAQLSGGASSATYRVEIEDGSGLRQLIFQRSAGDMNNSAPRRVQAEVQTRAGALGVPVARVVAITVPGDDLGDGVVTELVEGEALAPRWLRIGGYWYPRGGIPIDVFWQTGEPPKGVFLPDQGVPTYRGRG